jgi:cyclase
MLRTRIIPCLQLIDNALVKTVKFSNHSYIGDPINTVRIFNELEVDELCFLDIRATLEKRSPNLEILRQIAEECFMPLSYGGGVKDCETAKKILSIGFEKIVINTAAMENIHLISEIAGHSGNQSIIGSIDIKKNIWGNYKVYTHDGTKNTDLDPIAYAQKLEKLGVGELLITSMDQDGTWKGFDIEILKNIAACVNIPIIANGGAGSIHDIGEVVSKAGVSAVAIGSMVVYQKKGLGVLVNFPDKSELSAVLNENE